MYEKTSTEKKTPKKKNYFLALWERMIFSLITQSIIKKAKYTIKKIYIKKKFK